MQVEEVCKYDLKNRNSQIFEEDHCPNELKDDIKTIIKNEGFIKYDVEIKKLPVDGGNYMAELYEINISGITMDGQKDINIFTKQIHLGSGSFQVMVDLPKMFKLEKMVYKEVNQIFNELQDDAKVPVNERYKMVKCYDSNPGAIIMDNLCKQGYKTYSRTEIVSLEFAELAIENIAKFHALSFAIEKYKPDFFNSNIKTLTFPINFNDTHSSFQKSAFSLAMSNLKNDMRNRVEDSISGKLYKYQQYFESSEISCLCHGDYRVMNLMFREDDGKIADMIPLDYQLINYGNPLMDFMYLIFTATDKRFRKCHLSHLKDLYYKTLKNFLKYFDMDLEDILPRDTFERIYEDTLDYGLVVMITIGPFMFVDGGDVPDIANVSMSNLDFKVCESYKKLLKDIIEDFIELGHI